MSMWRTLHRSISVVAAVFLLNTATTGALLAWDEWSLRLPGGALDPSVMRAAAIPKPLPATDLVAAAKRSYDAAQTLAPDAPMSSLRLSVGAHGLQAVAQFGGAYPGVVTVRADDGARLSGPPGPSSPRAKIAYHQMLKRLHRGDFIGSFSGRLLSIVTGLCLLFLAVSGVVLYWQLWSRRRALFWT